MPSDMRKIYKRSAHSDKALKKLQELAFEDSAQKSLAGTTQAIDLIQGGVKANALPEEAWALVNHRISVIRYIYFCHTKRDSPKPLCSSVDFVRDHDTTLLKPLAKKFNLTYNAFGKTISEENAPSSGSLTLSDAFHAGLEPAPITPTGPDAAPFQLLSGTIRTTYKSHRLNLVDKDNTIVVAPGLMSGNTGTYSRRLSSVVMPDFFSPQILVIIGVCPSISSVTIITVLVPLANRWGECTPSMKVSDIFQ